MKREVIGGATLYLCDCAEVVAELTDNLIMLSNNTGMSVLDNFADLSSGSQ